MSPELGSSVTITEFWGTPEGQKTRLASDFALRVVEQQTDAVLTDFAKDGFRGALSREQLHTRLNEILADITEETQWMAALRKLRNRLQLRWIWQDANRLTTLVQLTRELSDFADLCIEAAIAFAEPALEARYGQPVGEDNGQRQHLIVIAMGKHGAQELNLSSDIDLIFCFDEAGDTTGRKSIPVQQYMIQLGQAVIRLLDQPTADGFVFRVDMRLRPWGDGSPLAISHNALERYLEQHGRDWERYAWIKARAVTGGKAGEQLIAMTRPFVYRRYVDYTAFAALREMKAMIEREVQRRQVDQDVKLGAGGIREIEFIVQAFQLIHGGARKPLRGLNCLAMLGELERSGLLKAQQVTGLSAAYGFLRRVEHGIQALDDQQTQQLPSDTERQQRLATVLGFADWPAFMVALDSHRQLVRQEFAQVVSDRAAPTPHSEKPLEELERQLDEKLDDASRDMLRQFRQGKTLQKLPEQTRQRLTQVWPILIPAILRTSEPSVALTRLLPFLEKTLRRSVYLVMLIENPAAVQRLVQMFAVSPWISERLIQYPVLLDEFLGANLQQLPNREQLADTLRQQLLRVDRDDVEGQMRVLRLFRHSEVLAVAASDVLAERPLMKVSDSLTFIAEVVLEATLALALTTLKERFGMPCWSNGERMTEDNPAFAIIGYGKLGGIELGYGSDLDLVFLHDVDEQQDTDGAKAISGMEFCLKLAQKITSLLTMQTLDGRVYEVDTRLRPSGESGVLVSSLTAFEHYQRSSAWLWEHQALVRARALCGGEQVMAAFGNIRQSILTLPRDEATVREEVRAMRQKMRDHLGTRPEQQKAGIFHLKQDAGGIVDIEFMAQYGVLAWSGASPELARFSDNVRLLDDMASAGRLPRADADALTDAYLRERAETHRLALAQKSLSVPAAMWHDTRTTVHDLWQKWIDPAAAPLEG